MFNFCFSIPYVLGFIYFQNFILELLKKEYEVAFFGALFYICSPITIVSQMFNFLTPMWLVALFPIVAYYYVTYITSGNKIQILKVIAWSIILSFAYYAIPWELSLILPLSISACIVLCVLKLRVRIVIQKSIEFFSAIIFSQLFWIIPFITSLTYKGENDLGGRLTSKYLTDSFSPTVLATATGNILYPVLSMYHRTIAFNYDWNLKKIFLSYYDSATILGLIFIVILFLGFHNSRVILKNRVRHIFIFFSIAFVLSLFFFTVNIGPLKHVFLSFRYIPGFTIFRNFTDKFALGYIFIYAVLLTLCLFVIRRSSRFFIGIYIIGVTVILIYLIPVKNIVAAPFWKTKNINTNINIPDEYLDFVKRISSKLPSTSNIISLPQNIASYAVITEDNGTNAYIGTSPFKFFTGINDLSGSMSFTDEISQNIQKHIVTRNYEQLLLLLGQLNIGYAIVSKNIPLEVKNTFLYDKNYLQAQDQTLYDSILDKRIIQSSKSNYELYSLKNSPVLFKSASNIQYKKINPITYKISMTEFIGQDELIFYETYHPGWKLFIQKKRFNTGVMSVFSNMLSLSKEILFDLSHTHNTPYGNSWKIDSNSIIPPNKNFEYTSNADGSINVTLLLFFLPQIYVYLGFFMTFLFLILLWIYLSSKRIYKHYE